MSTQATPLPFDQNDKKYRSCFGKVHIRTAARVVSVLTVFSMALSIIFSFTRSATVAFNTIFTAAFAAVIFGFLLYGTFKEKRLYLVPYLIFQVIGLVITFLTLLALLIMIAVNSHSIIQLAQDYYGLDEHGITEAEFNSALSSFVVLAILFVSFTGFIEAYFLEIIYRFWLFLKDRETSFNFTFDTNTTFANRASFIGEDNTIPPAYGTLS